MDLSGQVAKQLNDVYNGGNWTAVNLRDTLSGISWQHATKKVFSFNTIAALVYHINYYVRAVTNVLHGNSLDASDKFSFDHPPINSQQDWEDLVRKTFTDGRVLVGLIEQLSPGKFTEPFANGKYGDYHRNIQGVIEHIHYHLGQIILIKKINTSPR